MARPAANLTAHFAPTPVSAAPGSAGREETIWRPTASRRLGPTSVRQHRLAGKLVLHFVIMGSPLRGTEGSNPAPFESALAPYRLPREEAVPLFASLLSLPLDDAYPRLDLTQEQLKEHTADTIVALTLAEAERRPLLEVWEDVHWADPSTLDLLGQLIDQAPTVPLLIVLTYRTEFVPPWPARSRVRPLTLNRLERPQIEVMATRLP